VCLFLLRQDVGYGTHNYYWYPPFFYLNFHGHNTTAYTIGATLGPALGGYLAGNGDFYISAKMAVFGSLVSVALSLFYLPDVAETLSSSSSSSSSTDAAAVSPGLKRKRSFVDELRNSGEIALRSSLWPLLMVKVLGGVTSSMRKLCSSLNESHNNLILRRSNICPPF
jgi:hypothetical protein